MDAFLVDCEENVDRQSLASSNSIKFSEAVDHVQRITLSFIPWEKRRVSPESAATVMNLFQCNLPDFKGQYPLIQ